MWTRVFGSTAAEPDPAELLAALHAAGLPAKADFKGDDLGWTAAALAVGVGTPVYVERYLTEEDDIRRNLNSWAAWLETATYSPNAPPLMEKVIQAKQMITLRKPIDHADDLKLDEMCRVARLFLARATGGIVQVDGEGWYDAQGMLLVEEF